MSKRINAAYKSFFAPDSVLLPLAAAFTLLSAALFYPQASLTYDINAVNADVVICLSIVLCGAFAAYRYFKGSLDGKTVIFLMFICGFALRLAYVLRYSYYVHQHDVESLESSGHLRYIYNISIGNLLPDSNVWQFSHPPLHHFLAAAVVKITILSGGSISAAFENVQLLTCLYSVLFMTVGYKIFKECGIGGNALIYCSAVLAFHPIFSVLSGSINNDTLSILLSMYAVLYLMKWYRCPCVGYSVLTGLFTGLGMMTKFSVAMLAVVAAVTVIARFISDKGFRLSRLLGHTACYLGVMLPLGLWYQIRNLILFDQPIGYVAPLSTDSRLYIGGISIVKRLLLPFSAEKVGVYTDVWNEYNLWQYLLRNSLFGEYSFGSEGIAVFAVIANLLLSAGAIAALIYLITHKLNGAGSALPLVVLFFVQMSFFVYFNIKYPFRCSMDFRYIVPVLFCGIAFAGIVCNALRENSIYVKVLRPAAKFITIVFCAFSVMVYL